MRSFFAPFLSYFLTPGGLVLLAALDSSVVFFLPLGIDFVVIILSAGQPDRFWLYALLATLGSLAGAGLTFAIGRKVGEHGLSRFVNASRLERVRRRVAHGAAVSTAVLGIIPPPFPFTAFVLTSGALRANAWSFLATLAGVRLLRFGAEGALAAYYGRGILTWMKSPVFTTIVAVLIVVAVVGTIVSLVALMRQRRTDARDQMRKRSSAATPP
jgi:membrane protein YqaA with SNARE-associated domain